jgi:hypothetical protein
MQVCIMSAKFSWCKYVCIKKVKFWYFKNTKYDAKSSISGINLRRLIVR